MKKIVISSDELKKTTGLLSLVEALFPECEIQIVSNKEEYESSNIDAFVKSRHSDEKRSPDNL